MQVELCEHITQNNKLATLEHADCLGDLQDDINRIIKSEKFIKYNVNINKLPIDGGNYMGSLFEIDVIGTTAKGEKVMNLFVKQQIVGDGNLNKFVDIPGMYKYEKFVYKDLKNVFNQLQEDAKVPINERYKMVTYYNSNSGAIIMDNLCKQGYKTYSRVELVSLDYAEFAIKNLAKFHALSFAVEKHKPDFFESKMKNIKYPVTFEREEWVDSQKSILSIAMSNLDNELRNRVEEIILGKLHKYGEYFEQSEVSCLCHGDYRVMNLMIQEVEGKISDMVTLDYQLLNYGNPIKDLCFFIFTATDKKLRKSYLSHLKNIYYDSLNDFVRYFDVNIEEVFPRKTYERMFEETLFYGLLVITTLAPLSFVDETDVPDLANVTMDEITFKVHDVYKGLLRDVIEDFIEWGLL